MFDQYNRRLERLHESTKHQLDTSRNSIEPETKDKAVPHGGTSEACRSQAQLEAHSPFAAFLGWSSSVSGGDHNVRFVRRLVVATKAKFLRIGQHVFSPGSPRVPTFSYL